MDTLNKQISDLRLNDAFSSSKTKKIPPVVPPKNTRRLPLPPHGNNDHYDPSYASKLETAGPFINCSDKVNYGMSHDFIKISDSRADPSLPPPPISLMNSSVYSIDYDVLPPPSPVSSNYSELAQVARNMSYHQNNYNSSNNYSNYPEYGLPHASTYDPLYETINPPVEFGPCHKTNEIKSQPALDKNVPQEQEVDTLTNMLIKSMTNSQDLDTFGTCVKCCEKVVGENSGCTAMGNVYHIKCFLCHVCKTSLQGKPFYAVDGEPYCESDYHEKLEKCCICVKPILDRILRASGKPYHPACFTCIVCNKSLDGIPFTVDASNQIHCIEDFHKKFAPRCSVCELPIMPEEGEEETVRVVALDRSFHVDCYRCEDCDLLLSSESEGRACYPLDNHILCKNCNTSRIRMLTNVMTTDL